MQNIESEYAEFWDDYMEALIEEFLLSQALYSSALKDEMQVTIEHLRGRVHVKRETTVITSKCQSIGTTQNYAKTISPGGRVCDAHIRFQKAIYLLKNASADTCRWIVSQIDRIQEQYPDREIDVGRFVRYFAAGENGLRLPVAEETQSWYLILPLDGPPAI